MTGTIGTGIKNWNIDWTAPSSGEGTIDFFVCANTSNGDGGPTGDEIHTYQLTANEQQVNSTSSLQNDKIVYFSNNNININNNLINQIYITDVNGKLVKSFQNNIPSKINTKNFPNGIYIVQTRDNENKNISIKFNVK